MVDGIEYVKEYTGYVENISKYRSDSSKKGRRFIETLHHAEISDCEHTEDWLHALSKF